MSVSKLLAGGMAVALCGAVMLSLVVTNVFGRDDYADFSLTKALEYPPPTDAFQRERHNGCVAGVATDCHWLSLFFDKEPMRKRFLNERACLLKSSDACVNMAVWLWDGSVIRQDKERAVRIVENICAGEKTWYSCQQMSAWTGKPDPVKGKADATPPTSSPSMSEAPESAEGSDSMSNDELARTCEGGDDAFCFDLALRLATKDPKDEARARPIFERLCEKENDRQGWACDEWGVLLFNGDGGERNKYKAAELFEKSCNLNHARGCFNQGLAVHDDYSDGKGPGPSGARDLYAKACALGDEEGCQKAEWKSTYWCWTDFSRDDDWDGTYPTSCRDRIGGSGTPPICSRSASASKGGVTDRVTRIGSIAPVPLMPSA